MRGTMPTLTAQDRDRAADRRRVLDTRQNGRKGLLIWLLLGPGVLVMLGENDDPSMRSCAATGASYGIGFFLPFIALFQQPQVRAQCRDLAAGPEARPQ